jgi:hypothetical protein
MNIIKVINVINKNKIPKLNILKNESSQFKQTIIITCIAKYKNAYMIYDDF